MGGSMTTKSIPRTHRALVNAVDRLGRPIEPSVLSVAQAMAPKAISYAQKSLADPCVVMNLLEEAAATVSEAVLAKQFGGLPPIRDLRAYLYRAFLRRVAASRRSEILLEEAFEERLRLNEGMSFEEKLEARLLLKQILRMCDRKTMWIVWERIEGRSWEEIAYDFVMTNRAARLHYSRALREIRVALETNPQAYMEKLRQEELKRQRAGTLIHRIQTRGAKLLFQAIGVRPVFGTRFQITWHEREDILAEVDKMFSLEVSRFEGFSGQTPFLEKVRHIFSK
jgi:DNA-directed RNA polymerase specialized sigma24 family protein